MLFGSLIPYVGNEFGSKVEALLVLLTIAFLSSTVVGIGWYIDISQAKVGSHGDAVKIRKSISNNNAWLQFLVPRAQNHHNVNSDALKNNELVPSMFLTSFVFGLAVLAAGGILAIQLHEQGTRGVFGALLNFTLGRSISLVFSLYLLISSLSVLIVGLMFKITFWRNK